MESTKGFFLWLMYLSLSSTEHILTMIKHLWKHLLHQTCFRETIWHNNKCHFKVFDSSDPFVSNLPISGGSKAAVYFLEGKASKVGCENPKPWGFMMIQFDVRIYFFKWVGSTTNEFSIWKVQHSLSPETCSLDQTLANLKEFWAKQQEFCVFYYHCPSQRDFLNPELKVFWSF